MCVAADDRVEIRPEQWSSAGAAEEPWGSSRASSSVNYSPEYTVQTGRTQMKLSMWLSDCAKCGRALLLLFFKVTSGWDGLSSIKDSITSRPGVTDTIFDCFSFNSAADLLCIISSEMTPVKLNFHFQR